MLNCCYYFQDEEGVGITALKWSQSGPQFFTSTLAGTVVAWSAVSREPVAGGDSNASPLAIWRGHSQGVLDLALAPPISDKNNNQPAFVVSASDDATVRLFDLTELSSA